MKILTNVQYTGKKARVGSICFDENQRMRVFVNYCPECRGKVVMQLDEARQFARLYNTQSKQITNRLAISIVKKKTY